MSARVSILEINLANKNQGPYERKLDKDTRELRLTVLPGDYPADSVDLDVPRGIKASGYKQDDGALIFTVKLPRNRRKATITLFNGSCPCESDLSNFAISIALTADRPSPEGTILPL